MPEETPDKPVDNVNADLEREKLRADIEKVSLEIRQLRSWWKPATWQPIASIVVTLTAGIIGYYNGFFSTKIESLENRKAEVQRAIEKLETQKADVQTAINTLHSDQSKIQQENAGLRAELTSTRAELNSTKHALKQVSDEAGGWLAKVKELEPRVAEAEADKAAKNKLAAQLAQLQAGAERASQIVPAQPAPTNSQVIAPASPSSSQEPKAQASPVEWTGRVVSNDGKPLADVGISVWMSPFIKQVTGTRTDDDGKYTLKFPPEYRSNSAVLFTKDDYISQSIGFTAADLHTRQLQNVVMTRKP